MANVLLTNVTIAGNKAEEISGGIGISLQAPNYGSATVNNSIVWGNDAPDDPNGENASYTRSLVQDKSSSWPQNEEMDPLFVSPLPASSAPTIGGNYQIMELSPAISAADTNAYKTAMGLFGNTNWSEQKDMAGQARLVYNDLDLGAFEMQDPIRPQEDTKIIYVKPNGAGTQKGSSWANAYPNFQDLLYYASYHNYLSSPNDSIAQIWVVQGSFKPTHVFGNANVNDSRNFTFLIPEGVKVYGGFRTNANDLVDTIPEVRGNNLGDMSLTVLSGNIGDINNQNDNCYHVVVAANINDNRKIIFDGFKISDGKANGTSSTTFRNFAISQGNGGGLYLINPSTSNGAFSEFKNLIIENNFAQNGAGIMNEKGKAKFYNIIVRGNSSEIGGGIYNNSANNSKYLQSVVYGNKATTNAGGVYNLQSSNMLFLNTTIGGNNMEGMFNSSSNSILSNCIISNNDSSVVNISSSPFYRYSNINGCGGSSNWDSNYGIDQGNNVGLDVKFINAIDPATQNWTQNTNGDYRIKGSSPAINGGSDALYSSEFGITDWDDVKDIINIDRILSDTIDMGAYEMIVFTVDFEGIDITTPSQLVALNDHVELPPSPTRSGYYFAGWYNDSITWSTQWDFPNFTITQDTTLFAKWTEIVYHNVHFAGDNVSINSQYVEHGLYATEPTEPTRPHYTFGGWFTDDNTFQNQWNFTTNTVMSDMTLYAKWEPIMFNVNFSGISVSGIPTQQVQEGDYIIAPVDPIRQYYIFDAWYTDNGTFTNQWDFANNVVTQDTTLYAKWEAIEGVLTFISVNDTLFQQIVPLGTLATRPADPTKINYSFAGWYQDSLTTTHHFDFYHEIITNDTCLYAKWIQEDSTIYKVDFGGAPTLNTEPQYIGANQYAAVPTQPIRTYYDFLGWYTDSITFSTIWDYNTFPITSDTTIYSKWTLTEYTVTFSGIGVNIPAQTHVYGDLVQEPADPIRTNYNFDGWFTDDNTFINLWDFNNYIVSQDTVLFAKWTLITNINDNEITERIFPNPASNYITIEGVQNNKKAEIIDIYGRIIKSFILYNNTIDINYLTPGMYILRINEKNYKFIKE